MPGGGPHSIVSGQVTDDTEMAMCLMWALIGSNEKLEPNDIKQIDYE